MREGKGSSQSQPVSAPKSAAREAEPSAALPKFSRPQLQLLADLADGPIYYLGGSTRNMAIRLKLDGWLSYAPPTEMLQEKWGLTRAGRGLVRRLKKAGLLDV